MVEGTAPKVIPKKSLGQNFLTSEKVAKSMVDSISVTENDTVVEIGSGTGVVTRYLLEKVQSNKANLIAVEFDSELIPILTTKFLSQDRFQLENANILNYLDVIEERKIQNLKLIGSLPYNITSPLLHKVTKMKYIPTECVFLVQKEVGHKLSLKSPDSSYLSIYIQSFYDVSILSVIDKKYFNPIPKVDGAVIKMAKNEVLSDIDIPSYERFLHRCFINPRKMLNKVFSSEELKLSGFVGTDRPQNYDVPFYIEAYKKLITSK